MFCRSFHVGCISFFIYQLLLYQSYLLPSHPYMISSICLTILFHNKHERDQCLEYVIPQKQFLVRFLCQMDIFFLITV